MYFCGTLGDAAQAREGWEHQPGKVFICLATKLGQGEGATEGTSPTSPIIQVSSILTSDVESSKPGLSAAAQGSKPGLGPEQAGWLQK